MPRLSNTLKGMVAGFLGSIGDVGYMTRNTDAARRLEEAESKLYEAGGFEPPERTDYEAESKDVPGTSEWFGEQMGADTESMWFQAGTFLDPKAMGGNLLDAARGIVAGPRARRGPELPEDWFKGKDEMHRFEIDDSDSMFIPSGYNEMRQNPNITSRLADVFQHDELFDRYPELGEMHVAIDDSLTGGNLAYVQDITIGLNPGLTAQESRSAVLHELQHAVQSLEGFEGGTSVNRMAQQADLDLSTQRGQDVAYRLYRNAVGEVEARAVQTRADYPMYYRRQNPILDTMNRDVPTNRQLLLGK